MLCVRILVAVSAIIALAPRATPAAPILFNFDFTSPVVNNPEPGPFNASAPVTAIDPTITATATSANGGQPIQSFIGLGVFEAGRTDIIGRPLQVDNRPVNEKLVLTFNNSNAGIVDELLLGIEFDGLVTDPGTITDAIVTINGPAGTTSLNVDFGTDLTAGFLDLSGSPVALGDGTTISFRANLAIREDEFSVSGLSVGAETRETPSVPEPASIAVWMMILLFLTGTGFYLKRRRCLN